MYLSGIANFFAVALGGPVVGRITAQGIESFRTEIADIKHVATGILNSTSAFDPNSGTRLKFLSKFPTCLTQ